jgi:hypothetical protein
MQEPQNVDLRVIAIQDPSPDATCDVVFVHGLDGDPVKTWQHDPKHPELSWPNLLAADLPSVRVSMLGYPAEKFGGKHARAMSIEDRAKSVLENLAAEGFGRRQFIFIAHSLGGLLVKQMLRAAEESDDSRWRKIGEAVLGIVFLATPNAGAKLADVASALRTFFRTSVATLDLERYSPKLLNLREWYSKYSVRVSMKHVGFAETRPLEGFGIIVSEDSAWPGGTASMIRIDDVDHIQIAQPANREATVYKDVLANLQLWLASDRDPRQVPLERETHESDSEEISRFLFRTRRVPLFGRDDELRELQQFLDDLRPFTWCAITGPGGSGKSRLALEFCLQLSPKWRAGFLNGWSSTEFHEWTPNRPTLIVIDYVSARASDVGSIVRGLEGRSSTLPFPVRLVLLEREGDGLWVREFLGAGEDRRTSTRSQYVSFPAEPNPPSKDPYDEVIPLQTLVVTPLSPEALWGCMSSVFNSSASNHTGRSNHADHKGQLLAQLLEIDPSRRPLFAALFADAIAAADPKMLKWDPNALIENVLIREQENFWKPRGVTDVELDVLTLATLVRGVGYDCPDLPPAAHDAKQFSHKRYAIACGASASERLPPLEPDMVGEIFVLNRFKPSSKRSQAEEMRDRGWKIDSLEMSAFFSRAAKDFQDHPALWYLGSSPHTACAAPHVSHFVHSALRPHGGAGSDPRKSTIGATYVKRANATLFAAFFHFDVAFMVWVLLGPLALFIAKDLNLSITQKAFLVSIPPLGGALFRIILGSLSDQYGAKRVGV